MTPNEPTIPQVESVTDEHAASAANSGDILARNFAVMLAAISDGVGPYIDATVGYKARLVAAGMSPTFAEAAALRFHDVLMGVLAKSLTPQG